MGYEFDFISNDLYLDIIPSIPEKKLAELFFVEIRLAKKTLLVYSCLE